MTLPSLAFNSKDRIVGILLAAGQGARFDASGTHNKLLQPLASGDAVVEASAKNLLAALPTVLAVVRPGAPAVAAQLQALGCQVQACASAEQGMGASLVHALSATPDAAGWVVALGDMPYVLPATIVALVAAINHGAAIAVPVCEGRRGNPVAFSRDHLPHLLQLQGDEGARSLLKSWPVTAVDVHDPGIWRDIDRPSDLAHWPGSG